MFAPSLPWSKLYTRSDFKSDVFAGLTTGVMLMPQAMAYALLAGLPVEAGLYASTVPLFVYAFWGTIRPLAVGPVAMDSLLTAAAISAIAVTHPEMTGADGIAVASLLAIMVGVSLLLMGILKLGRVVSLLTPTIISAFTSAAAIIIGINQLKLILGVDLVKSSKVYVIVADLFSKMNSIHMLTLVLGSAAIVLLVGLKKFAPRIPRAFVVVLLSLAVVAIGDLGSQGVRVVGEVPQGLPSFSIPSQDLSIVFELIPHALIIAMVAFMEAFSIGSKLQKEGEELNPSKELIALGGANVATGFFQGYSVTGGLSRTAVNDSAGAASRVSGLITGLMVVLTLSFFAGALANIPKAVLGAIIMTAVMSLISVSDAKRIFTTEKSDIPVYTITFLVTLLVGIKEGLIVGVLVNWGLNRIQRTEKEVVEVDLLRGEG